MTLAFYITIALWIGVGSAVQTSLIGALGRLRGPTEATWISLLGTLCVMALVLGLRALWDDPPRLPVPFRSVVVLAVIGVLAALALAVSMRGLDPWLALTGLFGVAYLVAAAFLVPRVGIALYASAVTAGTLIGSVGLDHIGAFGTEIHRISPMRVAGILALIVGVVLVRGGR